MKKAIILFLILALFLCGCSHTRKYKTAQIQIQYMDGEIYRLTNEETEYVMSLLTKGKWGGYTKTDCGYRVIFDNAEIGYDSSGLFNDKENQRSLRLSEEQKKRINEIFESYTQ